MSNIRIIPLALALALTTCQMPLRTAHAEVADLVCGVADPTQTPLNLRAKPNGRILGALHNHSTVRIPDLENTDGKWVKVITPDNKRGWVLREYLVCSSREHYKYDNVISEGKKQTAEAAFVALGDEENTAYFTIINPEMSCQELLQKHIRNRENGTWLEWRARDRSQRIWKVMCPVQINNVDKQQ